MDSSKFAIKLFIRDPSAIDTRAFVLMFHRWIQEHAISDHMLIDVADYRHVENGPGTVLVAHEANYSMDGAGGRLGLLYTRKQPLPGSLSSRLQGAFRAASQAAALIESAPEFGGKLRFSTDDVLIRINDRLAAPNTLQTWGDVGPDLEMALRTLYGAEIKLTHEAEGDALFGATLHSALSLSINDLLQHTHAIQVA